MSARPPNSEWQSGDSQTALRPTRCAGETRAVATPLDRLIDEYLREADAGRVLDLDGSAYTPAGLRRLRRALTPVQAVAGTLELATLDHGEHAPEQLGRQVVEQAGLPPSRLEPIVAALRSVCGFAAEGGRGARATERPLGGPKAATPTDAMLILGAHVGVWTERIIVIAFVLAAIGLARELV